MALYKTKPWPPAELGFFKAGCLAIGMILGSYLEFPFKRHPGRRWP